MAHRTDMVFINLYQLQSSHIPLSLLTFLCEIFHQLVDNLHLLRLLLCQLFGVT